MSKADIIRAWKDEGYRHSLSPEELALVPEDPAGAIELTSSELEAVNGGGTLDIFTAGCCNSQFFACVVSIAVGVTCLF